MPNAPSPTFEGGYLGIDAGGTRTMAFWESEDRSCSHRTVTGPANLQLLSDTELLERLHEIARVYPNPRSVVIGMAGVRSQQDRQRIEKASSRIWPHASCVATHDLEIALAAARPGIPGARAQVTVLVLSGTGSCCYGRNKLNEVAKVGGWGHVLGDQGSAYDLSLNSLRAVIRRLELDGRWGILGDRLLTTLHLDHSDQWIGWVKTASKTEIAALAPVVFEAAAAGDALAKSVIRGAAKDLVRSAIACAQQLGPHSRPVRFVLAGGLLLKQRSFERSVTNLLRRQWKAGPCTVNRLDRSAAEGAADMARAHAPDVAKVSARSSGRHSKNTGKERHRPSAAEVLPVPTRRSPTEERNPSSMRLDRMALSDAIELMLKEDSRIPAAVLAEKKNLGRAIRLITHSLKSGGRLFYIGAGTSGRLGILDASECPPTFRTPPDLVQGIIAGGAQAVFRSLEGAEDDFEAGLIAIDHHNVTARDVVVGIAASGRTPFVWGALVGARQRSAQTILLCFNPFLRFQSKWRPTVVIAPNVGPEVLTGSTRLKAGTATKLILNIFSTIAMVGLGKVASNLMIDLHPSNAKLRDRAARIVGELTGADLQKAQALLEENGWKVKDAVRSLRKRKKAV